MASMHKFALDVSEMYKSEALSDFVLVSSDGQEFHVHRMILAARSPVFMAMFEMKNSTEAQTGHCETPDVNGITMRFPLDYIYCYPQRLISQEKQAPPELMDLVIAADKCDLKELVEISAEEIVLIVVRYAVTDLKEATEVLQLAEQLKNYLA